MINSFYFGSILLSLIFTCFCRASVNLIDYMPRLDIQGNADIQLNAKKAVGLSVRAIRIEENLPADGFFFKLSINSGINGYPGVNVVFGSTVDFDKFDVLAVWFKPDAPTSFFEVVINGANGVIMDTSLASYASIYSSVVVANKWHLALIPYKAEPGWVRYGEKMDFSKIKSLTFYTDAKTLSTVKPEYNFEIGAVGLMSIEEARKLCQKEDNLPEVYTGQKVLESKDMLVWSADSCEKIFKTTVLKENTGKVEAVSFDGAGHEYVSKYIVLRAAKDINGVAATVSEFTSPNGAIKKENITLRKCEFINDALRSFPDPLPLLNSFDVKVGENFIIWAEIYIPENTPKGKYTGSISLKTVAGLNVEIPLDVTVFGFNLPRKTHLKSIFTVQFFYGDIENFKKNYLGHWPVDVTPWNENYKVMIDNILRDFGEHRITPELFAAQFNCLTMEQRLEYICKYRFDPPFTLGYNVVNAYMGEVTDETRAAMRKQLAETAEKFADINMLDITSVKIGDEPTEKTMPLIIMAAEDVKKAAPRVQSFIALTEWPEHAEKLYGLIDAWCIQWNRFDFAGKQARERLAAGDKLWVYAAEYKQNTRYLPIEIRAAYWLYWKYNITGVHYSHHIPSVFLTYPNDSWPHSDGLRPIPSIRWEMIRDGIEDYEYFCLLKELAGDDAKYIELLRVSEDIVIDPMTCNADPRKILKCRADMAQAIEELLLR